jgi:thiol-disulfide isomerase/thioredoxin
MRIRLAAGLLAITLFTLTAEDGTRPSPPFTFKRVGDPGPPPITLRQYRGKIVALAFIHTTCPHCQELTRTLIPISRDYAPRGVQVLGCAFNEGADNLLVGFLGLMRPPFPVGWSTHDAVSSYLRYSAMNPMAFVPHMVFLDRRGIIRADIPGESNFFKEADRNIRLQLDEMLKTVAPAKSR